MESKLDITSRIVVSVGLLCALGMPGCFGGGDEGVYGEVSGKITVEGKPLTKGSISFQNTETGRAGAAQICADGTYEISKLLVGKYDVLILPPPRPPPMPDRRAPPPNLSGFPMKYRSEAMSNLSAEVKEGKNEGVNFDLHL